MIGGLCDCVRFRATICWCIENQHHWCRVYSLARTPTAVARNTLVENLALIRRTAMNLLRQGTDRQSVRQRKLRATVSDTYRERLLFGGRHGAIALNFPVSGLDNGIHYIYSRNGPSCFVIYFK